MNHIYLQKDRPYTKRIGLTLFRNQISTSLKGVKDKVIETSDAIQKNI